MVDLRIFSSKIQTVRILGEISQHVLGVENWPEKRNLEFFAHAIFRKLLKEIQNLRVGYLHKKWKF